MKETLGADHAIGVAAFPEHGTTSAELLTFADQCLYEWKSHGRDVTVSMRGGTFKDCINISSPLHRVEANTTRTAQPPSLVLL